MHEGSHSYIISGSVVWLQIADAKQPDLGYLTDPKQNVVKDFFKFATRSGTSVGSVAGEPRHAHLVC